MTGLDGNQPAKPVAKYENGPYPQRAASDEQEHAKPAEAVAIECPEFLTVRIGRQKRLQQSNYYQGCDHPAVIAVFTLTRAQIDAAANRQDRQHQRCDSHDA